MRIAHRRNTWIFILLLMTATATELLATRQTPEEKNALIRLAQQELLRQKKLNPLKYFVPTGKQEELIQSVGQDTRKWIFILPAANSSGKSATVLNILGNIIFGSQSEWFNFPRFTSAWKHPKKFWYISETSVLKTFVCGMDEGAESEIKKWFPKGRYTMTKAGYDYFSQMVTDNGWSGAFKTYEQDAKQFEGEKIGVAVFDEPPPETIFNAVLARMTLGGIIMMPMTPLSHSAWTLDRLVNKASEDSDIFVLNADIESACKTHGVRGYLEHSQIERILSQYDPEEVEARAHGRYTHLRGIVYKSIHPSLHRHNIPAAQFTQDKYQIYQVVDPHDSRPPFVSWFAVNPYEETFAIAEYPEEPFHTMKNFKLTTKEVIEKLKMIEQENGWDASKIIRVMDPNFGNKQNQTVGKTTAEWWAHIGRELTYPIYYTTNINDDLKAGHTAVRELLALTRDGEAKFKVGMNCPNIWLSLNRYAYLPRTGKSLEAHGEGEKVAEKFKDGADTVRYFKMYFWTPREPVQAKVYTTYDEYAHDAIFQKVQKRSMQPKKRSEAI